MQGTDLESGDVEAKVLSVVVSGSSESYQFAVEVSSPDLGCEQYADWWEIVSFDGELIYRRILLHSHVNEQPFTRSGEPISVDEEQMVWIRAHMNNTGYSAIGMSGSVSEGFVSTEISEEIADLSEDDPLPTTCTF